MSSFFCRVQPEPAMSSFFFLVVVAMFSNSQPCPVFSAVFTRSVPSLIRNIHDLHYTLPSHTLPILYFIYLTYIIPIPILHRRYTYTIPIARLPTTYLPTTYLPTSHLPPTYPLFTYLPSSSFLQHPSIKQFLLEKKRLISLREKAQRRDPTTTNWD